MEKDRKIYVASEYTVDRNHVGLSLFYDLTLLLQEFGAEVIDIAATYPVWDGHKLFNRVRPPFRVRSSFKAGTKSVLLVLCATPRFLKVLANLREAKFQFEAIAVYFVDGFNSSTLDGYGREILKDVDHVLVADEDMLADFHKQGCSSVHFLPFGIDAKRHAKVRNLNRIDVLSYGRFDRDIHRKLVERFNAAESGKSYVHSTFDCAHVYAQGEHRQLQWKLLSSSTINLCFEASQVPRFYGRSPILYRWFEAIAAGNVIVGRAPTCKAMATHFDWPDATIDIGSADSVADFLEELLSDRNRITEIQTSNQKNALKRHDWRYRIHAGYEIGAEMILEAVHNTRGGVSRGSAELASIGAFVTLDTEQANWWRGGEWWVSVLATAGDNPSDLTGDAQGISNIAAPRAAKIYEFWYRHTFGDDQTQVLFGLHDYNSQFYALESADLFTHASFGLGAEVAQVGPSTFPTTALGLVLSGDRQPLYWQMAIYDGVPGDPDNSSGTQIHLRSDDGLFRAFESGMREADLYKWGVGYWSQSARNEEPAERELVDDISGIYAVGERYFGKRWAVFGQLGYVRTGSTMLRRYLGAGVTYSDLVRAGDSVGLGLAQAQLDPQFQRESPDLAPAERTLEFTYQMPVLTQLSVQASAYHIRNPAFDPTLGDALAVGLRILLEY